MVIFPRRFHFLKSPSRPALPCVPAAASGSRTETRRRRSPSSQRRLQRRLPSQIGGDNVERLGSLNYTRSSRFRAMAYYGLSLLGRDASFSPHRPYPPSPPLRSLLHFSRVRPSPATKDVCTREILHGSGTPVRVELSEKYHRRCRRISFFRFFSSVDSA